MRLWKTGNTDLLEDNLVWSVKYKMHLAQTQQKYRLTQKYKQTGKKMFTASTFGKVKIWKQMAINRGMGNKMQHNMMEHYTAIK